MPMQHDYPTDCTTHRETLFQSVKASDIFLLLLLLYFCSLIMDTVIRQSGLCGLYYGQEAYMEMQIYTQSEGPSLNRTRLTLWSTGIAYPLLALLFPLIFKLRTGCPISLLGIHTKNLPRTIKLAAAGILILLPAAYLLQAFVVWTIQQMGIYQITNHPLADLAGISLERAEKILLFSSAVAGAAILEEELFRGLLLPWFLSRPNGSSLASASALLVTLVFQAKSLWHSAILLWNNNMVLVNPWDRFSLFQAILPVLFCLIMGKLIHLASQMEEWKDYATIVAVGLLFGMIHSFAWPSPVPLTLLGSGMGLVFYKTGNLLGPILIHSIFNGFAFLLILF